MKKDIERILRNHLVMNYENVAKDICEMLEKDFGIRLFDCIQTDVPIIYNGYQGLVCQRCGASHDVDAMCNGKGF